MKKGAFINFYNESCSKKQTNEVLEWEQNFTSAGEGWNKVPKGWGT